MSAVTRCGAPTAATLHWPTQAAVVDGRLVVCDVGNRRVLIWGALPQRWGAPADVVIGQPDLVSRSDNGGDEAGPRGLRWPHDLGVWRGDLVIADAGDNRLLVFDGVPRADHAAARGVLGQRDFAHVDHNQSSYWPAAHTLNMPYAVEACGVPVQERGIVGPDHADKDAGARADEAFGNDSRILQGFPRKLQHEPLLRI